MSNGMPACLENWCALYLAVTEELPAEKAFLKLGEVYRIRPVKPHTKPRKRTPEQQARHREQMRQSRVRKKANA